MLCLPLNRSQLLQLLPSGGVCAEIGVLEGDFSDQIMSNARPSQLYLIDPWIHQNREDYQKDHANAENSVQQGRHQKVLSRFARQIERGRVRVIRDFSCNAVQQFEDASLDWIYVDAVHSYEGALADLRAYAPKIKPDGLILGHDFTNSPPAKDMGFGVVEAVRDFLEETDFSFLALTSEMFPTFVLARDITSGNARKFIADCIFNIPFIVEIDDPFRNGPSHLQYVYPDKSVRYVMSF